MKRHAIQALAGIAVIATMLVAAGCASTEDPAPAAAPAESVTDDLASGTKDRDDPGPMPEEDYGDVPAECVAAFIPSAPSQWSDVERAPSSWPEPPGGTQLCLTSSTTDANIATFVSSEPWESTLAYYEAVLAGLGSSELIRSSGEDTGTGYEQLEGTLDGATFLIRESDSGFSLIFA